LVGCLVWPVGWVVCVGWEKRGGVWANHPPTQKMFWRFLLFSPPWFWGGNQKGLGGGGAGFSFFFFWGWLLGTKPPTGGCGVSPGTSFDKPQFFFFWPRWNHKGVFFIRGFSGPENGWESCGWLFGPPATLLSCGPPQTRWGWGVFVFFFLPPPKPLFCCGFFFLGAGPKWGPLFFFVFGWAPCAQKVVSSNPPLFFLFFPFLLSLVVVFCLFLFFS